MDRKNWAGIRQSLYLSKHRRTPTACLSAPSQWIMPQQVTLATTHAFIVESLRIQQNLAESTFMFQVWSKLSLRVLCVWFYFLVWESCFIPTQTPMSPFWNHWYLLSTTSCLDTMRWRSSVECLIQMLTWLWLTVTPSSMCLVFMTARGALWGYSLLEPMSARLS